ncbi:MAG: hypothetical protein ACRDMI_12160 [Streptosporangiaceae bacterium]
MTRGNFDLHFTPLEEMDRMAPYHFAVEVEDWDGFLATCASWASGAPGRSRARRTTHSSATSTTLTTP